MSTKAHRYVTQRDVKIIGSGFKNTLPSLVEPSQTLSLKQLIERHTRGQWVPQFQQHFDTDGTAPPIEWQKLSIEERYVLLEKARKAYSIKNQAFQISQAQEKQQEIDKQKERDERLKAFENELNNEPKPTPKTKDSGNK